MRADDAAHDREPEPEPALRAIERQLAALHERIEQPRQELRRDALRRCRARSARDRRLRRAPPDADAPAGGVNFAALLSRLDTTCARRSRSPLTRNPLSGTSTSRNCPRCSSSGLAISMPLVTTSDELDRLQPQLELAAGDARDVEEIVDQPPRCAT